MLRLLLWIVGILGLALISAWFSKNPGTLQFTWMDWRVDTSVAVVCAALVALCLIIFFTSWIIRSLVVLPRRLRQRKRERDYALGLRTATGTLVALTTGDIATAKKLSHATRRHLRNAPLALLLSAQTARAAGDERALHAQLETMLQHTETRFMAARGLSDYYLQQGNSEGALAYAKQAHSLSPRDSTAAEMLVGMYAAQSCWEEAEAVLRTMPRPWFKRGDYHRVRAALHMAQSARLETINQSALAYASARDAWKAQPYFAPVAANAAQLHAKEGNVQAGLRILSRAWKRQPHPQLAETFHVIAAQLSPKKYMRLARRFAANQPEHPLSHLLLAETALHIKDWQAAREYLMAALSREESKHACLLMAKLERERYHDMTAAQDWEKRANGAISGAWQCEACGHILLQWTAHCPSCQAFGHLRWEPHHRNIMVSLPPSAQRQSFAI